MADPASPWKRYLRFSSIGIELGLSVMIGLIGGQWLDTRFHTSWLWLLGLLLGVAAGFLTIYRALKDLKTIEKTASDGEERAPGRKP